MKLIMCPSLVSWNMIDVFSSLCSELYRAVCLLLSGALMNASNRVKVFGSSLISTADICYGRSRVLNRGVCPLWAQKLKAAVHRTILLPASWSAGRTSCSWWGNPFGSSGSPNGLTSLIAAIFCLSWWSSCSLLEILVSTGLHWDVTYLL